VVGVFVVFVILFVVIYVIGMVLYCMMGFWISEEVEVSGIDLVEYVEIGYDLVGVGGGGFWLVFGGVLILILIMMVVMEVLV